MNTLLRSRHVPALAAVLTAGLVLATVVAANHRGPAPACAATICTTLPMSDPDAMSGLLATHYGAHPMHASKRVLAVDATTVAAADTFLATAISTFALTHNGVLGGNEVSISAGQSIMFKWQGGIHTTTSGIPGDVDAGSLWDYALTSTAKERVILFTDPGVYDFHCYFHGSYGMTGRIIVTAPVPAKSTTWGAAKALYR